MIKAVIFDMYETLVTLYGVPVYFSAGMAEDAGIPLADFHAAWDPTETDRTLGRITTGEAIAATLRKCGRYTAERAALLYEKRVRFKKEAFGHLHPEILPLLETLRSRGLRIGLVSNCFSEEAALIRESVLFPYFDAVCLSYEEGIQKPDPLIFERCLEKLGLAAHECLYVGDGGSHELSAAKTAGMRPVQAVWYLKEGTTQPVSRMAEYEQAETPLAVAALLSTREKAE